MLAWHVMKLWTDMREIRNQARHVAFSAGKAAFVGIWLN
jgi:hypothetical protein